MWKLIVAIIMVESGGDTTKIGDGGRAVGCLQIHLNVIKDVNKRYHKHYTSRDSYSKKKSIEIFQLYMKMNGCKTYEDMARTWNGGPTKQHTNQYWRKVKRQL